MPEHLVELDAWHGVRIVATMAVVEDAFREQLEGRVGRLRPAAEAQQVRAALRPEMTKEIAA